MPYYRSYSDCHDGSATETFPSWGGKCATQGYGSVTVSVHNTVSAQPTPLVWYDDVSVAEYRSAYDDTESFSKIVQSGTIKMTPYSAGRVTTEIFPVTEHKLDAKVGYRSCHFDSYPRWITPPIWAVARYNHNVLIDDWDITDNCARLDTIYEHERAAAQVKSACVSRSSETLDLLTTLAEGRDTLRLAAATIRAVRNPLKAYRHAVRKYKNDPTAVADLWLKYRYAIMPEVYTMLDVLELLEKQRFLFKTDRSAKEVPVRTELTGTQTGNRQSYRIEGSTLYRATSKARFKGSDLRNFDQITFNPALTAWELIPYSFVVDWFINVGEVIQARSLELMDLADQREFCLSVKTKTVETYTRHIEDSYKKSLNIQGSVYSYSEDISRSDIGKIVTTETYDRSLFNPSDVGFTWNGGVNSTFRWLDSFALSLGQILNGLGKLR